MLNKPLFIDSLLLLLIVGVLNWLATASSWYWLIPSFDSFMHFLGGMWAVIFFLWLYFYSGFFVPKQRRLVDFFIISMLGLAFISVTWEVYELLLGEAKFGGSEYLFDTTLDFVMDTLGGVLACFYAYIRELATK